MRSWLLIRETPESPRMFQSDLVDLFSRTHPMIVPILFVPGASVLFAYSILRTDLGWITTALLAVGGFVSWTFAEYWLHRLFFHWTAPGR
jgi:putative flippase GtrA